MAKDGYKIGFVGAGKMAVALAAGILREKLCGAGDIVCSDPVEQRRDEVEKELGVCVTEDNKEVFRRSDIVVLAFKPQNFPEAVENMGCEVRPEHIIVSIMAGVRIERIRRVLPGRVVRVMPNTACLVGEMAAGYAAAEEVTEADIERVRKLLQCAGVAVAVSEDELDAVTGLSGSGPAFVAYLIESFIAAGQAEGLDKKTCKELILKTFVGTARLLGEWEMEPEELIKMVSSPNGTTVAGREVLEASDVREIIAKTVKRAAQRSKELGRV